MTNKIVVLSTAANEEEAERIARRLVEEKLAACVNVVPGVQSFYRWEGKIERQSEILLIAKTTTTKFADLEREVRALHSYETPEIIALPIVAGSSPYLAWLIDSLNP